MLFRSAAQGHAKVGLAAGNSLAHGLTVDGIVRTGVAVGAAVEHTSLKKLNSPKELKKEPTRSKCRKWQKSVKTDLQVKTNFFEDLLLLK